MQGSMQIYKGVYLCARERERDLPPERVRAVRTHEKKSEGECTDADQSATVGGSSDSMLLLSNFLVCSPDMSRDDKSDAWSTGRTPSDKPSSLHFNASTLPGSTTSSCRRWTRFWQMRSELLFSCCHAASSLKSTIAPSSRAATDKW